MRASETRAFICVWLVWGSRARARACLSTSVAHTRSLRTIRPSLVYSLIESRRAWSWHNYRACAQSRCMAALLRMDACVCYKTHVVWHTYSSLASFSRKPLAKGLLTIFSCVTCEIYMAVLSGGRLFFAVAASGRHIPPPLLRARTHKTRVHTKRTLWFW